MADCSSCSRRQSPLEVQVGILEDFVKRAGGRITMCGPHFKAFTFELNRCDGEAAKFGRGWTPTKRVEGEKTKTPRAPDKLDCAMILAEYCKNNRNVRCFDNIISTLAQIYSSIQLDMGQIIDDKLRPDFSKYSVIQRRADVIQFYEGKKTAVLGAGAKVTEEAEGDDENGEKIVFNIGQVIMTFITK